MSKLLTLWLMLTATRFSWFDVALAVILMALPGIILALIPWRP